MATGIVAHERFSEHTIHTAKCERCLKHNRNIMYRCRDCDLQICTPCMEKDPKNGAHYPPTRRNRFYIRPTSPSARRSRKLKRRREEGIADGKAVREVTGNEGDDDIPWDDIRYRQSRVENSKLRDSQIATGVHHKWKCVYASTYLLSSRTL